jgi:23S rRNA (guanosine2251-2'-O)-methyltransferase
MRDAEMEIIWGRNPVLEALRSGRPIHRLMVASGARGGSIELVRSEAARHGVPVVPVDRRRLDAISPFSQGVVAEAAPFRYQDLEEIIARVRAAKGPPIVLALDSLQDPQNFGTLLRTAAAVGAVGVLLPEHRAVGVTPAVAKAAAGATEHLAVARVTNMVRALGELKAAGLWVVGLEAEAEQSYDAVDLAMPLVVVIGGEGKGLGRLVGERCDLLVKLPMAGMTESLNAAVAGSIVLFEAYRQRGFPPQHAGDAPARERESTA